MGRVKGIKITTHNLRGKRALRKALKEQDALSWIQRKTYGKFYDEERREDSVTLRFSRILERSLNLNSGMQEQAEEMARKYESTMKKNRARKGDYTVEVLRA